MELINFVTLAILGYIDLAKYKIPNVILAMWLVTEIMIKINVFCLNAPQYLGKLIFVFVATTGIYLLLSRVVECNAGDFKLYGVLTAIYGTEQMLVILFISSLISLYPLASGCKKVPCAFFTFFGYLAFQLLKYEGII